MLTRFETEFASISDGVGGAGSPTDIEPVVLRDGSSVVIGPVASGDGATIVELVRGAGCRDPPRALSRVAGPTRSSDAVRAGACGPRRPRGDRGDRSDGTTVGIARYIRIGKPNRAEVAVAVGDEWRGRGIASMLLERVTARARSAGIEQFIAICLASNHTVDPAAEPAGSDDYRAVRRRGSGTPDRPDESALRSLRSRLGERRTARSSEGAAMSEEAVEPTCPAAAALSLL